MNLTKSLPPTDIKDWNSIVNTGHVTEKATSHCVHGGDPVPLPSELQLWQFGHSALGHPLKKDEITMLLVLFAALQ